MLLYLALDVHPEVTCNRQGAERSLNRKLTGNLTAGQVLVTVKQRTQLKRSRRHECVVLDYELVHEELELSLALAHSPLVLQQQLGRQQALAVICPRLSQAVVLGTYAGLVLGDVV